VSVTIQELTPEGTLALAQAEPGLIIVDCREGFELSRARLGEGAPRSLHIPLAQLEDRVDELDPEAPVVVMCHHGVRSMQGAWVLQQAGFERVWSMRGGIELWATSVDPAVGRY
jgi:rhodanese-related sulfurtransferase